ncbi:MAG TPA: type II toxin-antitoxin system RelE/ParE family toxin [Aestuariivirga sp.]
MIATVRHKALRRLFETGDGKGLPPEMLKRLKRMMTTLNAADDLKLLESFSGWRLHPLKGDLDGYYSLSVSGNWRLIFKWHDGVADEVDLVDYH